MPDQPVRPNPGDIIEYRAFDGVLRRVRVTAVDDDIKNGRPGFDGYLLRPSGQGSNRMLAGEDVWGYDDQITAVVPARGSER